MLKRLFSFMVAVCIVFTSVSTANAFVSETADLLINAVDGALQTDDEKLVQEIIAKLSDDKEKQKLKEYVEKTRPTILDKSNTFHEYLSPAFLWIEPYVFEVKAKVVRGNNVGGAGILFFHMA